jgi:hypothetical protein
VPSVVDIFNLPRSIERQDVLGVFEKLKLPRPGRLQIHTGDEFPTYAEAEFKNIDDVADLVQQLQGKPLYDDHPSYFQPLRMRYHRRPINGVESSGLCDGVIDLDPECDLSLDHCTDVDGAPFSSIPLSRIYEDADQELSRRARAKSTRPNLNLPIESSKTLNGLDGSRATLAVGDLAPGRRKRNPRIKDGYRCGKGSCEKLFDSQAQCTKHRRIHLPYDQRPYPCSRCELGFVESRDLRRHLSNIHHLDFHKARQLAAVAQPRSPPPLDFDQPDAYIPEAADWTQFDLDQTLFGFGDYLP